MNIFQRIKQTVAEAEYKREEPSVVNPTFPVTVNHTESKEEDVKPQKLYSEEQENTKPCFEDKDMMEYFLIPFSHPTVLRPLPERKEEDIYDLSCICDEGKDINGFPEGIFATYSLIEFLQKKLEAEKPKKDIILSNSDTDTEDNKNENKAEESTLKEETASDSSSEKESNKNSEIADKLNEIIKNDKKTYEKKSESSTEDPFDFDLSDF